MEMGKIGAWVSTNALSREQLVELARGVEELGSVPEPPPAQQHGGGNRGPPRVLLLPGLRQRHEAPVPPRGFASLRAVGLAALRADGHRRP